MTELAHAPLAPAHADRIADAVELILNTVVDLHRRGRDFTQEERGVLVYMPLADALRPIELTQMGNAAATVLAAAVSWLLERLDEERDHDHGLHDDDDTPDC